jgi:hypothetical protein
VSTESADARFRQGAPARSNATILQRHNTSGVREAVRFSEVDRIICYRKELRNMASPHDMMASVADSLAKRTGRTLEEWVAVVRGSGIDPMDQNAVRRWRVEHEEVPQEQEHADGEDERGAEQHLEVDVQRSCVSR